MTRKKSNVKALALAVTCAILAGGYSGLNPVYAAEAVNYDSTSNKLTTGATTEIDKLVVGGVTIGRIGSDDGIIIAKSIEGITREGAMKPSAISINGAKFANNGAITATSLKLNEVGDVASSLTTLKANTGTLQTKTTNISYNDTTGTTVDGVVLKEKGISAAGGKFTVYEDGKTVFKGDATDNGSTTIKAGETVVKGANGTVTINNSGINIAQKEQDTNKDLSITLDSGYVKASGYVQAPKFYIDNNNVFAKEADGTSRLTVSEVGENGEVTKFVRIGGGTISASGDVNVVGSLWVGKTSIFNDGINTDKIDEKTTGAGVTVEGVKFKAGAVSGISDINDGIIKFSKNGTKDIVQINSDLMFNDDAGRQAATLTLEGVKTLNGLSNGSSKIKADDGSVVGGVKFDNKNITDVDSVMVNKDANNQVQINSEGIVVGLHSTVIGSDGVYAGGHTATTAKAVLGADGSIKGAGYGAGKYKFTVDSSNGTVTINDGGNVATISGGGISIADASGSDYLTMGKGTVLASASVISPKFFVDPNNAFEKNSLKVGDGTKGVTIADGEITTTGDTTVGGKLDVTGNITGADITASGALKGKTLGIGATGNEFKVDEDGAVKAAGGKVTIDKDGNAQFGDTGANITKIQGNKITTGYIQTDDNIESSIGGVKMQNGKITANDMTVTGNIDFNNLTVKNTLTVGTNTKITEGTLQLGTDEDKKLTADKLANINQTIKTGKVIDANSATIGGVEIKGGNVITATGTIQGNTISDGAGAKLNGGKITANEGKIGNVEITTAGAVSGVTSLTVNGEIKANVFKVDDDNYLNNSGITAKGGKIGAAVVDATTLTVGGTKLDNAAGITTNKLAIGGMTLTGTSLDTGTADFQVNGVTFNQGEVAARADKGFVAGTSSFKQGSLIVDAKNKLEVTNGLTTEKATVNGTLDVSGKATFGTAGSQTAIDGNTITTDTLKANKLILGASGATTVEVDKDGSLKAANGKFEVDKDGALKAANGAFNVDKDGKTTFTKDANNLSSINGGNIWAKATDIADNTSSELTHDYKGLHIKGNKSGQKSAFDFDTASGIGTFTGQDNSTTKINGSAIRSEKSDGTAGKLDGENLTLYKDANNQTTMSAGKVKFKSANAGQYHGTETTIDGGVITTDTLNVQRINLGKEMVNGDGTTTTVSNLSIDEYGNIKAAGGKFTVAGTNQTNPGALHNEVGKTSFDTTETGASMKFDNTAATDGVKSEVSVGANQVTMSAGNQTVTTTKDGTVFENSDHNTPFGGGSETKTTINGNEITTGKITTDQLVIKGNGSGDADGTGNGSIALGGDGSIKSNIKDTTTGIESTFETKADKIGSVITGGTVELRQELDANTGKITNKAGDMSTELDNNGFTVKQNGKTDVKIADGDVTVTNNRNTTDHRYANQTVNLSDLGSLNNLDGELAARDEYQNNKTAVGAINAEAGIRREEVARLDNRIDDVNNRVDKVGAMAAAIASLKSIGYDPQAPSEFSIGLGQYKGETGVAMGFFHYPNKNFMINVSLSTAGGETMGGIGATWRFGHKSPQKLLEEQREAQAKKELAAAEKYQAAAKLAKEAQERAEYAAKLARQAQVSADNAKAAADATQAKHFQ